jgi:cytosine/adenosine deaminase-related metal-dependent hydrolase
MEPRRADAEELPFGGITFINACLDADKLSTLRIHGPLIASIGGEAESGDRVIDLQGDRLLPGLINAHDHLHLNSLPTLPAHEPYRHLREWIAEVNERRRCDPAFERCVSGSYEERLLHGGIKNLLSGVTCVVHHDPHHALLRRADYPISVLAQHGWSHSLYLDGDANVRSSYVSTPITWPWMIHAAEGLDEDAHSEFDRLETLGCINANTRLVHGIALCAAQRHRLEISGAGLVWCPASNSALFGKTATVDALISRGRVALGTDSRLSGSRDLLDEIRVAAAQGRLEDAVLESLVTSASARLLRLSDRGILEVGSRADLLVLPATARLSETVRAHVRLVVHGGQPKYGDSRYALAVSPRVTWAAIRVDGTAKLLHADIAAAISRSGLSETGVEFAESGWKAA